MFDNAEFQSKLLIKTEKVTSIGSTIADLDSLAEYRRSVFLSSAWLIPWLTELRAHVDVYSIRFLNSKSELVGICFVTGTTFRRRSLFNIRQLSFNESEKAQCKFIIEYNDALHNPDYTNDIYYSLIDFFANSCRNYDELRINAMSSSSSNKLEPICQEFRLEFLTEEKSKAYLTNLNAYNADPNEYIKTLSKNRREQIRRSIKYYSQHGKLEIHYADDNNSRKEYFFRLGELHQKYWERKGLAGSFSNNRWREFHLRIIKEYPDNVHLVRISFGSHILGYLYNLFDNNVAYSIQSGFNYSDDKNDRPGIISHFVITNDYIKKSFVRYEYLAGESQYKLSLSNSHNLLHWNLIQKKTFNLKIENSMLKIKRSLFA